MARKKVNKYNPKNWAWTKIGAGAGALAVAGMAGFGGASFNAEKPVDTDAMEKSVLDKVDKKFTDQFADLQASIDSNSDLLVAEDVWKSVAETLVMEEVEDDDYEDLIAEINNFDSNETVYEVNKVVVKDVTYTNSDVDDRDAVLEMKLRVYYEREDGDNARKTVTVNATIEDGEVEKLDFVF